jgi:hypothetical protein
MPTKENWKMGSSLWANLIKNKQRKKDRQKGRNRIQSSKSLTRSMQDRSRKNQLSCRITIFMLLVLWLLFVLLAFYIMLICHNGNWLYCYIAFLLFLQYNNPKRPRSFSFFFNFLCLLSTEVGSDNPSARQHVCSYASDTRAHTNTHTHSHTHTHM